MSTTVAYDSNGIFCEGMHGREGKSSIAVSWSNSSYMSIDRTKKVSSEEVIACVSCTVVSFLQL